MTDNPSLSYEDYLDVTYVPANSTGTLSDVDLISSLPLDHTSSFDAPQHDMGGFDLLPLELQQIVLGSVDLQTLTDFRRVNRRARQIVDSVPDYANILKYSPNSLRAALGIQTARYVTCTDLWRALTSSECAECSTFGDHIYIPTSKRLCFRCMCENPNYRPTTIEEASRHFVTDKAAMKALPSMISLPGQYSIEYVKRRARIELVTDIEAAKEIGISLHGTEERMKWAAERVEFRKGEKYERRKARATEGGSQKRVRRPARVFPKDKKSKDPLRFVAVIKAPVIYNKGTSSATEVWGRRCIGCRIHTALVAGATYDSESFQRHEEQYGKIEMDELKLHKGSTT